MVELRKDKVRRAGALYDVLRSMITDLGAHVHTNLEGSINLVATSITTTIGAGPDESHTADPGD